MFLFCILVTVSIYFIFYFYFLVIGRKERIRRLFVSTRTLSNLTDWCLASLHIQRFLNCLFKRKSICRLSEIRYLKRQFREYRAFNNPRNRTERKSNKNTYHTVVGFHYGQYAKEEFFSPLLLRYLFVNS